MTSDELIGRLKSWKNGGKEPPYKMIIFPTSRCNLNCRFCKSERFLDEEISNDRWLEIVQEGIDLSVEEWWITGGGEPLIRKNLTLEMVRKIKENGKYCDLMSNGTLINSEIAEELVSYGLDRILLSLDGPDASTNDCIRGRGSFSKVIEAIKKINRAKEELNSEKPKIQISSVINSKNYQKVDEIFELGETFGVDEVEFHQMLVYGSTANQVKDLVLNEKKRKELTESISQLEERSKESSTSFNGDAVKFYVEEEERCSSRSHYPEEYFCLQPFYTLLVDMLGEIAPCCPGGSSSKDVGLLDRDLKEVWYGDYLTDIRKKISQGQRIDFCENCGVNNLREDVKKELNI